MKHPERVEDYLKHIAQAIERATLYVERLGSAEAFRLNQRDQDAVIRNIEIIGEAARQIQRHDPEFVTAHPELPWSDMRDMRNKVIHHYFEVDHHRLAHCQKRPAATETRDRPPVTRSLPMRVAPTRTRAGKTRRHGR
jgi:uncharacterized protein with HEPN domain